MDRYWKSFSNLLLIIAPILLPAALVVVLYGTSLSYGFMFDDPLDLPRASGRSFLSILTSAGDSSYYRPLILIIWKALYELLGGNQGPVLHSLALVAHIVNCWLVYHMASRLQGRLGGYIAAFLFASFPLSYQAVAYVNAFFHTLVTTFLLLSVVSYWKWRENDSRLWLSTAVISAILAVLTHEYGVTVAALIAALEIYLLVGRRARQLSPSVAIFVCISVGFLLIWLMVPKWQHVWQLDFASLKMNSLYFFQGLVYPVAGNLTDLDGMLGLTITQLLLLLGGLTIIVIVGVHFLARRISSLGFALFWTAVGVLPALLTLPFSYLLDGPRLFYLASVGICIAWSGLLSAAFSCRINTARVPLTSLSIVLGGLILVQSVVFVQQRNPLLAEGAKMIQTLAATANDPVRPGRTYVNFPSWFALKSKDYPIGHTGVVMVPDYIGLGRAVYIQNGNQPDIASVNYNVVAREWDYHYASHGTDAQLDQLEAAFRRGGGVYVTGFYTGSIGIEYVGAISQGKPGSQTERYLADFGGWGRLISGEAHLNQQTVDVSLQWNALAKVDRDYTMFVHIYNMGNKLVAQTDGYPIGQMFPPEHWLPGDLIDDHRLISLPHDTPPGDYRVVVGIYDRQNGQRVQSVDAAGKRYRDDAIEIGSLSMIN